MKSLRFRHVIECSPEGYWSRCVLDADHNYHLFLEELRFATYTPIACVECGPPGDPGARVERLIRVEPNPPAGVPAIVRGALAYEETGILDRPRNLYLFETRNCTMPDAVSVKGFMRCKPHGEGACDRETRIDLEIRQWGLGFLEDHLAAELRRSFDASARFANTWLRSHPVFEPSR